MTAAKAVEVSVTSTNSLSQDYTNLDDQLPNMSAMYCSTLTPDDLNVQPGN